MLIAREHPGGLPAGQKPREPRHNVVLKARMRVNDAWADICIRNISSRGMLIQAADPPQRGAYVEIFKATHSVIGRVMWSGDRRFGIHTQNKIDITGLMGEAAQIESDDGAGPNGQASDRRNRPRAITQAQIDEQLARSRRLSAFLQFVLAMAGILAATGVIASIAYDSLSRPFEQISKHLGR